MKLFRIIFSCIFLVLFSFMFIQITNIFGWDQRVEWGMKPPYHWVERHDLSNASDLTGSNGKVCATLYRFLDTSEWVVYGYGFNEYGTKEELIRKAERECQ